MLRIAELPLNEKFLEIDPNNFYLYSFKYFQLLLT